MDIEKRSTGFGAAVILFAVFLRLAGLFVPGLAHSLRQESVPREPVWTGRGPQNVLEATQPQPVHEDLCFPKQDTET